MFDIQHEQSRVVAEYDGINLHIRLIGTAIVSDEEHRVSVSVQVPSDDAVMVALDAVLAAGQADLEARTLDRAREVQAELEKAPVSADSTDSSVVQVRVDDSGSGEDTRS